MFGDPSVVHGAERRQHDRPQKAPLKGLFSDGIWKCNCDPRLPAPRFQTKNGGKNHGRWCKRSTTILKLSLDHFLSVSLVYTCQKPQPTRCDFFLWEDEAKPREATVLFQNKRPEVLQLDPQTPTKSTSAHFLTPSIEDMYKQSGRQESTPSTPLKPHQLSRSAGQEISRSPIGRFQDWPPSDAKIITEAVDEMSRTGAIQPPETPKRITVTGISANPGKRKVETMLGASIGLATPSTGSTIKGDKVDIFTTPGTVKESRHLFSQVPDTPSPVRFKDGVAHAGDAVRMSTEIFDILNKGNITLPPQIHADIIDFCQKQVLCVQGIVKGRDLSRKGIQKNQERATELQGIVEALQAERETARAVIRHLRGQLVALQGNTLKQEYR